MKKISQSIFFTGIVGSLFVIGLQALMFILAHLVGVAKTEFTKPLMTFFLDSFLIAYFAYVLSNYFEKKKQKKVKDERKYLKSTKGMWVYVTIWAVLFLASIQFTAGKIGGFTQTSWFFPGTLLFLVVLLAGPMSFLFTAEEAKEAKEAR